MTTNQKIEASREIRQWVMLGVKVGTSAVMAYALIPDFKRFVDNKAYDIKQKFNKEK